ncbi:MAG: hypothetical protein HeimC2_28860 [Candidatus Heimdallarchaeota archaeon LC_2]|nr:MAG: hypothetical protein HeimC2_28860 [Candidatus Heimdallarchaeota archaeon LC_2]
MNLTIFFGLLAAISWGISDFSGGLASKKQSTILVLFLSQIFGILTLFAIIVFTGENYQAGQLVWSALGGIAGAIGLLTLYHGFSKGTTSIISPISAITAISLPVIFSIFINGIPSQLQIIGLTLAIISIVLLSIGSRNNPDSELSKIINISYGLVSGLGFGMFFIFVSQFKVNSVFWPLAILRFFSLVFLTILIIFKFRNSSIRNLNKREIFKIELIAITGIGDTLANVFFTLAAQSGRLDVASILASLFPIVTILLAFSIYKEKILSHQKLGILGTLISVFLLSK